MSIDAAMADLSAAPLEPTGQPITALVYDDGSEFDRLLWSTIGRLKARGLRLAGVAQINEARPGRRRCDMIVEDLSSGNRVLISQDRGNMARGCRLDHGALAAVTLAVEQSLLGDVDILIVNKFGKEEVEGRGLRDAVALAVERGIPVLIGVPNRNYEAWRIFCAEDGATTSAASGNAEMWAASNSAPCQ